MPNTYKTSVEKLRKSHEINVTIIYGFLVTMDDYVKIFNKHKDEFTSDYKDSEEDELTNDDEEDCIIENFSCCKFPINLINSILTIERINTEYKSYTRLDITNVVKDTIDTQNILIGFDTNYLSVHYDGVVEIPNVDDIVLKLGLPVQILNDLLQTLKVKYDIEKKLSLLTYCNLNK